MFKPKPKKKLNVNKKTITTIDNKHGEIIDEFTNKEINEIPKYKKDIEKYRKMLKDTNISIEKHFEVEEQIKELQKNICKIREKKKKYLLDNSKYIFNYFEKKKEIREGTTKKKVLHSFFAKEHQMKNELNTTETQKYLINIDEDYLDINNYIVDKNRCDCKGELIPIDYEGVKICNLCGKQQAYLIQHEKPSYKEPPKDVCFYAYRRINHFKEILSQFQAKETTQIPDEVIERIKLQIKKERITLEQLNNKKSKDILKKLGYNKYYEHISFIKDKLGIKPPIMSPELEERLCNLFMEIEKHYTKHCPNDRVNFLNYYYVLYKLCELLNENIFLPFFPMLKDSTKRIEQDITWKGICKELDWQFIPTI